MKLLAVFACSFAALGVRLTIRVINRRERWAKRTLLIVTLGSLVFYVLALGPVVYLDQRGLISQTEFELLVFPFKLCSDLFYASVEWWQGLAGKP